MPWGDCKVCFDFDGDLELEDRLWEAFWPTETAAHKLPDGWSLNETDGTGARLVVVFRVEGELRRKDGEVVARLLRSIATANGEVRGASRPAGEASALTQMLGMGVWKCTAHTELNG